MPAFPHRSLCLSVVVLFAAAPLASANLIVNGGFESPSVSPSGFQFFAAGNNALAPWTITAGSVDVVGSYWPAFQGAQSLDLAGTTNNGGAVKQSFATTPGQQYVLSFNFANNVDASSAKANVSVIADPATVLFSQDITHSGSSKASLPAMNYTPFSTVFTATSSTTTLQFTHIVTPAGQTNNGIVLDNVAVTHVVAEPTTLLLFAATSIGAVLAIRRRKRTWDA